jgi:magnesium-transporting ATPase (P-type)
MLLCSALVSALMRQYDDALSIAAAVLIVSTVAFIQVSWAYQSTNRLVCSFFST